MAIDQLGQVERNRLYHYASPAAVWILQKNSPGLIIDWSIGGTKI